MVSVSELFELGPFTHHASTQGTPWRRARLTLCQGSYAPATATAPILPTAPSHLPPLPPTALTWNAR